MHLDASPVVFLLNNPRKVYLNTIIEKQSIINREGEFLIDCSMQGCILHEKVGIGLDKRV